jgi:RHS repeat-associated protein
VIVATYSYDAYGAVTGSTGTASTPFQYAGQYTDGESGLQYLRARYYDPQTAQFITVDPLVGTTQEPYGYAGVNPLNVVDPLGLWGIADVGNFLQQHAGTMVAVGYVGAVGVAATCAFVTLGACVAVDLAVGGAFFAGGTLAATALLPPGEGLAGLDDGLLPGEGSALEGACPYTINPAKQAKHLTGSLASGDSQWLFWVDSTRATQKAAVYADIHGLWDAQGKAKVFVRNGPVGVLGKSGEFTSWINVYRKRGGSIHGAPGNAP